MKKAELEKLKASRMGSAPNVGPAERYGRGSAEVGSRREQRRLDQARGLVPFAVKLDGELVKRVRALAEERKADLGEVVAELLHRGLEK